MASASLKEHVTYIATRVHRNPDDIDKDTHDDVLQYTTVHMTAELFDMEPYEVATAVLKLRKKLKADLDPSKMEEEEETKTEEEDEEKAVA